MSFPGLTAPQNQQGPPGLLPKPPWLGPALAVPGPGLSCSLCSSPSAVAPDAHHPGDGRLPGEEAGRRQRALHTPAHAGLPGQAWAGPGSACGWHVALGVRSPPPPQCCSAPETGQHNKSWGEPDAGPSVVSTGRVREGWRASGVGMGSFWGGLEKHLEQRCISGYHPQGAEGTPCLGR